MKKLAALLTGLLFIFSAVTALWAQDTVHVVKKGDTLWDITRHYLANPWKWPIIWSNNPDITNPHLIFPGDRVVISTKNGKTTITIIPAKGGEPTVYTPAGIVGLKDKSFLISPQYASYIYSPNPLTGSGTVAKKIEAGDLMSKGEGIVIKSKSGFVKGKGVTIVAKITEVREKGEIKGYLYKAVGIAKIDEAQGSIFKATVADSTQEIREGDIIFDELSAIAPMKITLYEPTLKESGRVMDLYGGSVHGSSYLDLIFLNVGKNDGVDKGAVVSLYRETKVEGENGAVRDYQGNALVLQALEGSSVALVMETRCPIERDFVVLGAQ